MNKWTKEALVLQFLVRVLKENPKLIHELQVHKTSCGTQITGISLKCELSALVVL